MGLHGAAQGAAARGHRVVGLERTGRAFTIRVYLADSERAVERRRFGIAVVGNKLRLVGGRYCGRQRGAVLRGTDVLAPCRVPRREQYPQERHAACDSHAVGILRRQHERQDTQDNRRQCRHYTLVSGPSTARPCRHRARPHSCHRAHRGLRLAAGAGLPHTRIHCHGHNGIHDEHARTRVHEGVYDIARAHEHRGGRVRPRHSRSKGIPADCVLVQEFLPHHNAVQPYATHACGNGR